MIINKETLLETYRHEGTSTIDCLRELTDESLNQAVSEQDRTLGEIAWHITESLGGFAKLAGIELADIDFGTPMPESAAAIADAYEKAQNESIQKYEAFLTDENLLEKVDFFGSEMSRLELLTVYLFHQTHHRGQMTVLMRQADLNVPDIYGPARK